MGRRGEGRAARQCQWGERGGTDHGAGATPPGGSGAAENGEVSPAVDRVRYVVRVLSEEKYCVRGYFARRCKTAYAVLEGGEIPEIGHLNRE